MSSNAGVETGVVTVLLQSLPDGHAASPPPLTVAVLVTFAAAAAVGVTGMVKLVLPPTARPAAMVQVTVWPEALQPAGNVPMVRPAGIGSLTAVAAVVAAVPPLLTVSV